MAHIKTESKTLIPSTRKDQMALIRQLTLDLARDGDLGSFGWHTFKWEPARHHKVLIEAIEDPSHHLLICAPPGSAKTNWVGIATAAWVIGMTNGNCLLSYVSQPEPSAIKVVRSVRDGIDTDDYREVFPGIKPDKSCWNAGFFNVMRTEMVGVKDYTMQAIGPMGKFLGSRATHIWLDDLSNQKNTKSLDMMTELQEWVKTTAVSRLTRSVKDTLFGDGGPSYDGRVMAVMTRWHEMDTYKSIIDALGRNQTVANKPLRIIHMPALGYWQLVKLGIDLGRPETLREYIRRSHKPTKTILTSNLILETTQTDLRSPDTQPSPLCILDSTPVEISTSPDQSILESPDLVILNPDTKEPISAPEESEADLYGDLISILDVENAESLWPEHTPREEFLDIYRSDPKRFWLMYQQIPFQIDGQILKGEYWSYVDPIRLRLRNNLYISYDPRTGYPLIESFPRYQTVDQYANAGEKPILIIGTVQFWDTAMTAKHDADFCACRTFGVGSDNRLYILDDFYERLDYPDLIQHLKRLYALFRPYAVVVERKASGQSLHASIQRECMTIPIELWPAKGSEYADIDKIRRAHSSVGLISGGRVVLPTTDSCRWVSSFISTCSAFPQVTHDDRVDTLTMGLLWFIEKELEIINAQIIPTGELLEYNQGPGRFIDTGGAMLNLPSLEDYERGIMESPFGNGEFFRVL